VYDSRNQLIAERLWTEQVTTARFEETVSPSATSLTQRVFDVQPGEYAVIATVRDNESMKSRRVVRYITIPDYSNPAFSLSDVMIVSRLQQTGERRAITPLVSTNVGNLPEGFHAFFEAYTNRQMDSVRFVATVFDKKGTKHIEEEHTQYLASGRTPVFIKVPSEGLPLGDYTLVIRAQETSANVEDKLTASTNRSFFVQWLGIPKIVKDIDLAIEQLQYIAKDAEMKELRAAKTLEEKQQKFLEFWRSRDRNPNTPRNERLEEYYAKVEYANRNFRHYIDGWKTDMGMVYIIFGSPNNVDRHPFDPNSKPYEVWSYYELNHRFVFVDQTGFGDYRLVTPIWEVWQRPQR
jgi:GWxTD domain-containing protein